MGWRNALLLGAALASPAGAAFAQQKLPPVVSPGGSAASDERLARLERLLDSGVMVDMATRLDRLQEELQQLRGQVELHGRDLEVMKQRQRDLYQDIDRRLRRLEVGGGDTGVPPATPPLAATPAAPAVTAPAGAAPLPPATLPAPPAAQPVQPLPATAPAAAPAADPAQVQRSYQAAFDLLKEGRYAESISAFQQFLASYPGEAYADNAQYWLGEANYVSRQFQVAVDEFRKVLQLYPASAKVPDAMLKLGYAYYELQDWAAARAILTELRQKHPDSTAARLAASRLQRMSQEGR
ncbi:MAG TPA: tol-pal system protein YbgF [Gammaproteobacteria bacterium]